ncbi:MAG: hypothetical protein ACYDEV_18070 [Acidiferrobacter sp.]
MYKRRARVVFWAASSALVECATRLAETLAAEWIQVVPFLPSVTDCDLLVTLDQDSLRHLPELPAGCRHKHWVLAADSREADLAAHVQSLVGGMRLLAGLDQSDVPQK